MKYCVAQIKPVKGNIQRNLVHHKQLINLAISHGAGIIIFPELSLTGYEPQLASQLSTSAGDPGLDELQQLSDANGITIGAGLPLKNEPRPTISMILLQPHQPRQTYSKKYLHADEEEFFMSGQGTINLLASNSHIALAICYEISVPEHPKNAFERGAKIYIASVAKTRNGVNKAIETLSGIASKYSMTVCMSNCVGPSADGECAGRSSIWNFKGELLAQLDGNSEGMIIFDSETQEIISETISIAE